MSISGLTPVYSVIRVNMGDTDGQLPSGRLFRQQTGFIKITFRDSSGAPVNNVRMQVAFGQQDEDRLTLDYNGKARCSVPIFSAAGLITGYQTVDNFRLFWNNTPGVFAFVTVSQNSQLFEDDTPNPIQSFTQSVGTIMNTAAVTITIAATLIRAANANRQSVVLRNKGANTIYIGNSGVTTASGQFINPNDVLTIDRSTAAIYGIVAAATEELRYLEETI